MNYLERILRWIVIAGIFLFPFIPMVVAAPNFIPGVNMFFPYITGKNFAFRIIVEVMAAAWLALALVDARWRPKRSWILGTFAIFIFVIAIADAQGVNPFKSFWSNFERMDGWITLAHTFIYLVIMAAVVRSEVLWRRLFQTSLVVSIGLSAYGLLQVLGIASLGQGAGTGLAARIDSTFGNPIYLAIYMLFHVFIAALLIYQEWGQRWTIASRIAIGAGLGLLTLYDLVTTNAGGVSYLWWIVFMLAMTAILFLRRTYFFGVVIVLDTIALLLTETRGTTLGLVAGIVVTALALLVTYRTSRPVRRFAAGAIVLVCISGVGIFLARDSALVHNVGFLNRLSSISGHDITIAARIVNMETAWQGVKERPILGWGQENYAVVFDKYYDPRMYNDEQWFDRVHNVVFDWLIAGGVVGFLAYASIFLATLYLIWRRKTDCVRPLHPIEQSILTGLLVGYVVHNLTVFDNVSSYILWATILAYIVWRSERKNDAHLFESLSVKRTALVPLTVSSGVVLVIVLWYVNGIPIRQNTQLISILLGQDTSVATIQSDMNRIIGYNSIGTQEAREQYVQIALSIVQQSTLSTQDKQELYTDAGNQLLVQEKISPLDARFPLFLGTLAAAYGDTSTATAALEKAHELSPRKQTILYQQAQVANAVGDTANALADYKLAFELEQDNMQARILYVTALLGQKQTAAAMALLTPVATSTSLIDEGVVQAFTSNGDVDDLHTLYGSILAANPLDPTIHMNMAEAYYKAGDTKDAVAALNDLAHNVPVLASQVQQVIDQINAQPARTQ